MLELEALEYPKPNREFIYSTFNEFAARHPWVGQENIRPKSIVREMVENFFTFSDYIREYDLHKLEGVLLRYLMSVYKVLDHTVPVTAKNDALGEIEVFLRTMVRQVDSSLLEEWEKMRDPNWVARETEGEARPPGAEQAREDITRQERNFVTLIRTEIFSILRSFASRHFEGILEVVDDPTDHAGQPWTGPRLDAVFQEYLRGHGDLRLDPEARNLRHTYIKKPDGGREWLVQQTLVDFDGANDWSLDLRVDLAKSRELGRPHLQLLSLHPIGSA